jgi:hypothetical protein
MRQVLIIFARNMAIFLYRPTVSSVIQPTVRMMPVC